MKGLLTFLLLTVSLISSAFEAKFDLTFPDFNNVKIRLMDASRQPLKVSYMDSCTNGHIAFIYSGRDTEGLVVLSVLDVDKKESFGIITELVAGEYRLVIHKMAPPPVLLDVDILDAPEKAKRVIHTIVANMPIGYKFDEFTTQYESIDTSKPNAAKQKTTLKDSITFYDSTLLYTRSVEALKSFDLTYSFATLVSGFAKLYQPRYQGALDMINAAIDSSEKHGYHYNDFYIGMLKKQIQLVAHPSNQEVFKAELLDNHNNKHNLTEHIYKYRLVVFWASWCGPCVHEIPDLKKLAAKFSHKGLSICSISIDKDHSKWLDAINKYQLTWPQYIDDTNKPVHEDYGILTIPTMFLVDAQGNILKRSDNVGAIDKFLQQ